MITFLLLFELLVGGCGFVCVLGWGYPFRAWYLKGKPKQREPYPHHPHPPPPPPPPTTPTHHPHPPGSLGCQQKLVPWQRGGPSQNASPTPAKWFVILISLLSASLSSLPTKRVPSKRQAPKRGSFKQTTKQKTSPLLWQPRVRRLRRQHGAGRRQLCHVLRRHQGQVY